MKKKIISLCLVIALIAIAITGATLAYFTDTEADVNTMTTGNVKIDQTETDENGDEWEPEDIIPEVPVIKNVNVENTGNQDAYVRTLIAYEDTWDLAAFTYLGFWCTPDQVDEYAVIPSNGVDDWLQFKVTVNGAQSGKVYDEAIYTVLVYNYGGELLKAGESADSLHQVKLNNDATNEWSEYAAGAYNEVGSDLGTYDVVVLTQAVQAGSFTSAEEALNAGFGAIDYTSDAQVAEWFQEVLQEQWGDGYVVTCEAFDYTSYAEAIANGETICGLEAPSWMLP